MDKNPWRTTRPVLPLGKLREMERTLLWKYPNLIPSPAAIF